MDGGINTIRKATGPVVYSGMEPGSGESAPTMYVYAVVLDDNGNMMTGRTITGSYNDVKQLDHEDKNDLSVHHAVNPSGVPNYYSGSLTFVDDGSITGDTANDGIYTASADLTMSQANADSVN